MQFDLNSVNSYINSYITSGLTGFKSDFIEESYEEVKERLSNTTTGKATIISEGIATYSFIDNMGETYILHTKIAYTPQCKYRLISLQ